VIVVLVVFGLIFVAGIVAAIAIPNFLMAAQRAKQKRTMADQRSLAVALETYATDNHQYPRPEDLERELVPKYIPTVPAMDGWGRPFRYECWSSSGQAACDAYGIGSAGKDGTFERAALREYTGSAATTNFDLDIVFINGSFAQYPQGTSR
jgi:type II secretory pathway pseudopilin PulG